jgi:hypothetical protein
MRCGAPNLQANLPEQELFVSPSVLPTRFGGVAWGIELPMEVPMNGLIYLIGLIVVIMAVLSLLGLH